MAELWYTVPKEMDGRRVKSVARGQMGVSSHQFSRLKYTGGLTVDGRPAYANTVLRAGQAVRLVFEDRPAYLPAPCPLPLSVAYEDEHLLIVVKPAPLPTQSSPRQEGPALENAVFHYLGCPEDFVFRPVNRLDKGTSGLMAAAKTAHCHHLLQELLHTDSFLREYIAVTDGLLTPKEGVISFPLGKAPGATVRRQVMRQEDGGKPARTHYQVIEERDGHSLVRLRLETGRTHQIRVHLASMGCPVHGDFLYGREAPDAPGRFLLHSCLIDLLHPLTGERITRASAPPWEGWDKRRAPKEH